MHQLYTRKSIRDSLTQQDKIILEHFNSAIDDNAKNKRRGCMVNLIKNWDKYVYTSCILLIYMTYGLCMALFPPALVDMSYLFNTSLANVNYANTFISAGYLVGSFSGFLYKYVNRQLSFIISITMLGLFLATEPFCTSIWQFYGAAFLSAFGGGVWDSGNTVWVVEMWGENSSPVLQLSQMMFGIGTIIAPLLDEPFISGDQSATNTTTTVMAARTTTVAILSSTQASISERRQNLKIPFLIAGCLTLIMPVVLLVMFIMKRYKMPEKRTQGIDTNQDNNHAINELPAVHNEDKELSSTTRKILVALVAISLNSYSSLETTYFNYCTTYFQYLPIKLSAKSSAKVMAVMSATYTAGQGVSAFISSKVRPEIMLSYHMAVQLISLAILYFGQTSLTIIYIGNALIGFGFSAMWPSYFAFSENHLKLTNRITAIYSIVSVQFQLAVPFLMGPFIEKHPDVFLTFEIALFSSVVILFIIIIVVVKRSQRYPITYTVNNSNPGS